MVAARASIYQMISDDPVMHGFGIGTDTVYASGAVDNPQAKPFVIIRFGVKSVEFGKVGSQNVDIWVHDIAGDYSRIDKILNRIQELMIDAVHVVGLDGVTLTSARYISTSDDLWDDGYRTITRFSTFETASRMS